LIKRSPGKLFHSFQHGIAKGIVSEFTSTVSDEKEIGWQQVIHAQVVEGRH
jgi:hypothetical protein